jgi:hypothetical protein
MNQAAPQDGVVIFRATVRPVGQTASGDAVVLGPQCEPHSVTLALHSTAALAQDPRAEDLLDTLSYSDKQGPGLSVARANTDEARQRAITDAVAARRERT